MARRSGVRGFLSLTLVCTLWPAEPTFAQQGSRRPTGREAYESARARDRNLQNRTMAMEHAGDEEKKTLSDTQLRALISKMKEDFRTLQIANNNMMRKVAASNEVDYKSVLEGTDAINKCAKRLQSLISTPDTEGSKKDENKRNGFDPEQVRSALFRLDDLVMSFVTSPLFKNLVDAENAEKAWRDLTGIIDLSGIIKKNAEKLSKTSPKS